MIHLGINARKTEDIGVVAPELTRFREGIRAADVYSLEPRSLASFYNRFSTA